MNLLTTDIGWAATDNKLFWTTDGGSQWKDITPKLNHKRQEVSSVFFLGNSAGWALLKCGDDRDVLADEGCFELASTTNAGKTWAISHEKIAVPFSREYLKDSTGFSGQSWLDFVDSQNGWELLGIATRAGLPTAGEMLRTVDGGKTWLPTKGSPQSDRFHFVTTKDGWSGGAEEGGVFVSHDAGETWRPVSVNRPTDLGPDRGVTYQMPVFQDNRHGFLPVRYEVGPEVGPITSSLVLFFTDDGGKTWRESTRLTGLPDNYGPGIPYPEAVTGSVMVTAVVSSGQVSLFSARAGAKPGIHRSPISVHASSTDQLSFVSPERGWVLADYWLLSTSDGGISWTNVTPDPQGTIPPLA
jgi:photosystem II stability/assembly factor-like uncharacterized protein